MTTPTRPILAALGLAAVGVAAYATPAHAANCGGQGAAPQPVPYTCTLPGIDITFSGVTRHFSAVVFANGTSVTVTYTMSAPLPVPVPIRIVHHVDISGAGLGGDEASGVIPAGQTSATLVDSVPCRAGQLDVKAVFVGNGQAQGRVGGPWITNGTGCIDTQTTIPATTIPATTVPVDTTTPPVPPTAGLIPPINEESTTSVAPTVAAKVALPATGDDWTQAQVGIAMLAGLAGIALIVAARRQAAQ